MQYCLLFTLKILVVFIELHFKSGKISVIIFLGPLLMELHFLFMNAHFCDGGYVSVVNSQSGGGFIHQPKKHYAP